MRFLTFVLALFFWTSSSFATLSSDVGGGASQIIAYFSKRAFKIFKYMDAVADISENIYQPELRYALEITLKSQATEIVVVDKLVDVDGKVLTDPSLTAWSWHQINDKGVIVRKAKIQLLLQKWLPAMQKDSDELDDVVFHELTRANRYISMIDDKFQLSIGYYKLHESKVSEFEKGRLCGITMEYLEHNFAVNDPTLCGMHIEVNLDKSINVQLTGNRFPGIFRSRCLATPDEQPGTLKCDPKARAFVRIIYSGDKLELIHKLIPSPGPADVVLRSENVGGETNYAIKYLNLFSWGYE